MKNKFKKISELIDKWEELGILDGLIATDPNSKLFDVFKNPLHLELEKLEKELVDEKKNNRDVWNAYGSELCAADMIEQEKVIERKIKKNKRWNG